MIRDAREHDLAAIVAIYNAAIPGRQATADTEPVSVESRRSWFLDRAHDHHPIWVWEQDGQVTGWLSFGKFYGRPAYAATAEVSIYVDPAAQRRGIARALLQQAIARAPSLGLETFLAFVFAHNARSVALCLDFGFERWGSMPRVARLDGVERDLLILGFRVGAEPPTAAPACYGLGPLSTPDASSASSVGVRATLARWRPHRAVAHRRFPRRHGVHRALQLRPSHEPRRQVHPAHRGHRSRAFDAEPERRSCARSAGSGWGGTRAPTSAGRRALPSVGAAGDLPARAGAAGGVGRRLSLLCTAERLEAVRIEQRRQGLFVGVRRPVPRLDTGRRRGRIAAGEPFVVRLAMPRTGEIPFIDRLRGEVKFDNAQIDDQILLKTDGFPTYHLANVVDDHLMAMTHVIRAEEWLSSTPKHVQLYKAFGWQAPEWVHMPLLRNADKSKISKRKNPVSLDYYRDAGFLPEALLNYLGTMGWSISGDREKFTLDEMVAAFSFDRISLVVRCSIW